MNQPIKVHQSNSKIINQKKAEEREAWHQIVIKVLNWKDHLTGNNASNPKNKISKKEWQLYSEGLIKNNITHGKEKTLERLEETRVVIQKNGGFED